MSHESISRTQALACALVISDGSASMHASARASCTPEAQSRIASPWSRPISRASFRSAGTDIPSASSVEIPNRAMPSTFL
jgi:hypothetical protein